MDLDPTEVLLILSNRSRSSTNVDVVSGPDEQACGPRAARNAFQTAHVDRFEVGCTGVDRDTESAAVRIAAANRRIRA